MKVSRTVIISTTLLFAITMPQISTADIYEHIDDDGVAWFTDSPHDSRYQIIMRERPDKGLPPRRVTPAHLSATGIEAKLSRFGTDQQQTNVLPIQGKITSLTGLRHDPIDGKLRHHNGVDIAAPSGTPVKPVSTGVVVYSGIRPGYGNMVIVDHQNGTLTVYAHHSVNLVTEGELVDNNKVIALSGSTGRSTGPHLHFEAWNDGNNITSSFLPDSVAQNAVTGIGKQREIPVQRILQADGTLLFTNIR